jgi:hypothetical protein
MITLREALTAHLCGLAMGIAIIIGTIPPTIKLLRLLLS